MTTDPYAKFIFDFTARKFIRNPDHPRPQIKEDPMDIEELHQVGTNQAVIQKIENGKSKRPRILADLAIALDVNPAWLQWGEPYAGMRVDS